MQVNHIKVPSSFEPHTLQLRFDNLAEVEIFYRLLNTPTITDILSTAGIQSECIRRELSDMNPTASLRGKALEYISGEFIRLG